MSDESNAVEDFEEVSEPVEAAEEVVAEETSEETEQAETTETEAESSTAQENDWREKRLAKVVHQRKQAEKRIRELEEQVAKYAPAAAPVAIPDYPPADLAYDDPAAFQKRLQEREKAIEAQAEARVKQSIAKAEQDKQAQTAVQEIVSKYVKSGLDAGITEARMTHNEEVLTEAGISADLAKHLYADAKGALIVNYLAENYGELEKVAGMSPLSAVEYIATQLKPKVISKKPSSTQAPDPVSRVRGHGNAPVDPFAAIVPAGCKIS